MINYNAITKEINEKNKTHEDKEYIFVDEAGNILSEVTFCHINHMIDFIFYVYKNQGNRKNLINLMTGELLSKEWFYEVRDYHDGYWLVTMDGYTFNFINKEGKFLSDKWFSFANEFMNGKAIVKIKDEFFLIDTKSNISLCTDREIRKYVCL